MEYYYFNKRKVKAMSWYMYHDMPNTSFEAKKPLRALGLRGKKLKAALREAVNDTKERSSFIARTGHTPEDYWLPELD